MSIRKLIPLLRQLDRIPPEQRRELLKDPAGDVELSDQELEAVAGGAAADTECVITWGCCNGVTNQSSCVDQCGCSGGGAELA